MEKQPEELKKLVNVATDLVLPVKVRTDTIKYIANMATRESFLALLELGANEQLTKTERVLALKFARDIVKSGH
ncbi:MAG: hypothetical protein Q8O55_02920 [Dehalococcoidales bacterium]|nr:hypothetical protein [Dehalococcoidales bacterium]